MYQSFFFSSLHLYVLATVVYLLYYVTTGFPSSKTGVRQWNWLRSLSFWDWCKQHYFAHYIHTIYTKEYQVRGRAYLFLSVHPPGYFHQWADFSAFSVHGKKSAVFSSSPLVNLPRGLFKLPYLNDVLQWFGCISGNLDDIATLMRKNTSVVIPLERDDYATLLTCVLMDCEGMPTISIIPVLHQEIVPLYRTVGSGWQCLAGIRRYTIEKFGFSVPIFSFGWFGTCLPRKRGEIHTYLGRPIHLNALSTRDVIAQAFDEEIRVMDLVIDQHSKEEEEDVFQVRVD